MFTIRWQPVKTSGQLNAIVNPVEARQPEAIPWILYDTQQYVSATTTTLSFFTATNSDKTLSNMEASGQLPDPQYMEVQYLTCDILAVPQYVAAADGTGPGTLTDIARLTKAARTTITFQMSNKNYGPFPLRACHSLGGETGVIAGTTAAGAAFTSGNNGVPGSGGFPFMGALVIPPKVGFSITLNFQAAQTLLGGNTYICIGIAGTLYRRVL